MKTVAVVIITSCAWAIIIGMILKITPLILFSLLIGLIQSIGLAQEDL